MKRLLILAGVVIMAGASGCKCGGLCGGTTANRPYSAPAPTCCPQGTTTYAAPGYAAPGVMGAPALDPAQGVPMQSYPGPEAYTPAN